VFRLLVDHDFNERIVRGVQSRAEIDAIFARDVGLDDEPDSALLAWAAAQDRIVLSHDLQTMPAFAIARVRSRQTMPELILVPQEVRIGKAIEEITTVALCSDPSEWRDMIVYIPL
jgi:predicted nuclease of predicted toxin-antitoxin system